jgi:hypothetical protein
MTWFYHVPTWISWWRMFTMGIKPSIKDGMEQWNIYWTYHQHIYWTLNIYWTYIDGKWFGWDFCRLVVDFGVIYEFFWHIFPDGVQWCMCLTSNVWSGLGKVYILTSFVKQSWFKHQKWWLNQQTWWFGTLNCGDIMDNHLDRVVVDFTVAAICFSNENHYMHMQI